MKRTREREGVFVIRFLVSGHISKEVFYSRLILQERVSFCQNCQDRLLIESFRHSWIREGGLHTHTHPEQRISIGPRENNNNEKNTSHRATYTYRDTDIDKWSSRQSSICLFLVYFYSVPRVRFPIFFPPSILPPDRLSKRKSIARSPFEFNPYYYEYFLFDFPMNHFKIRNDG